MAPKTVMRDGQQWSSDMVQRMIAASQAPLADCPVVGGVGTGLSAGVVGKMNGSSSVSNNHFVVTANATNLVLTIQAGWAWLVRDSGSSSLDPRILFTEIDQSQTVTLASNAQGSTRVDTIALRVDMTIAPDATGSNLPSIVIIQGGASSAVGNAPTDSALYLALANVTVANGATSVAQGNVADKRFVHPSQATWLATLNSAYNFTASAFQTIPWDTVVMDKAGMFTTGVGAKWTCALPGWFDIESSIGVQVPNIAAAMGIYIIKNGTFYSPIMANQSCPALAGIDPWAQGKSSVLCAYGDVLTIQASLTTAAYPDAAFLATASLYYNFFRGVWRHF
jgi:hypothetical protein